MNLPQKVRRAFRSNNQSGRSELARGRIIVFGDSHVHALQEAIRHRTAKGRKSKLEVRRLLKTKGSKSIGDMEFDEIVEIARSLVPDDVLVAVIGGNQHAVFSTIQHPQLFDFLMPGDDPDELADNAEIIPYRMLYDYFASGIRGGDVHSIKALRTATAARVVQLLAPPPKGDNSFIENYHDTRFAEEDIASLGVSSPALRMKFWRLQNQVIEQLCAELGVETLPPPEDARDADGFMARDCYANDATHANDHYGELVLQQLEQRLHDEKRVARGTA